LIINDPLVCAPSTVDLTAPAITAGSDAGLTITYWMDAGATIPLTNPGNINVSGTYYIKAGAGGACTIIKPVVASIAPQVTVDINPPNVCADGGAATITAIPSPAGVYSYLWTVPTGATNPGNNSSFTSATAGTYGVTVTNNNGCTASATSILSPTPTAVLTGAGTICSGETKTITVNLTGTPPFQLTYSDGTTTRTVNIPSNTYQLNVNPTTTTTYTVLSVRDVKCTNTNISSTVVITVLPVQQPVRYPTIITPPNAPVQIYARDLGAGSTYSWNPSIGLNSSSIINPVFKYDRSTEYTVRIFSNGCPVVDTILIQVVNITPPLIRSDLFVPKAWSPNKDGHNDKLFPLTVNIAELKYFRIFNRWGQLMFETSELGQGWDGIYNGKPQVMDVYTWTVEAIGVDGVYYKRAGNSVLLR
jgi:gliding motility-associated-like protein